MSHNKFYMKEGVLVAESCTELSVTAIVESAELLLPLVGDDEDGVMPLIVWCGDDMRFDLNPSKFSKVINNKLMPHVSSIFVISKNSSFKQAGQVINSMFLGGKTQFFDEFEAAFDAAKDARGLDQPLLEQN